MTKCEGKAEGIDIKGLLAQDADFVRVAVEVLVQAALEAENQCNLFAASASTQVGIIRDVIARRNRAWRS